MLREETELGNVKLFIDTMDNNANEMYAALPERLFILNEGRLSYVGGVGPFCYNLEEVEKWLRSFEKKVKRLPLKMLVKQSQKNHFALSRED